MTTRQLYNYTHQVPLACLFYEQAYDQQLVRANTYLPRGCVLRNHNVKSTLTQIYEPHGRVAAGNRESARTQNPPDGHPNTAYLRQLSTTNFHRCVE